MQGKDMGLTEAARGPSQRGMEIAVALGMLLLGGVVIFGSLRVGIGWGAEGPMSGFFPFYVALTIIGASIINLLEILARRGTRLFAEWTQLGQVLLVLVPTTLYVGLIPAIGIYVTSIVLVTWFMTRIGHYRIGPSLALASTTMVVIYFAFEKWFLVALPKGPLENWVGL